MSPRHLPVLLLALGGCTQSSEPGDPDSYAATLMAGMWAADMSLDYEDGVLTVADDGLPDRGLLEAYAVPDGTVISALPVAYSYGLTMSPVLADAPTENTLGAIGVTLSGGLLFNPYDGGEEVALDLNFEADGLPFIDACNGHPGGRNADYHYHGVPYCITDTIDEAGEHSSLLGALLDGFPLYGAQGAGGTAPTDLDDCNGHTSVTPEFPEGIYHYHLSETAPYSILCYSGEVTTGGGGGPPAGGGEPPAAAGGVAMCADPTSTGCCGDDVCDGPEAADTCPADC